MKYLYTIKEQNFIKDCIGVKKKEKILLKGTSLKKLLKKQAEYSEKTNLKILK